MSSLNRYTTPVEEVAWQVEQAYRTTFSWEYDDGRAKLLALYDKGKRQQWNAADRIDWSQDLDPENPAGLPDEMISIFGSPAWHRLDAKERTRLRHHIQAWQLSQFLHGEQGALFAAAQVTEAVPWLDAKLYGSTQVVDEGRHVEVFHRYLSTKLEWLYEIDDNLYVVVDALMSDGRWDVKFLGMQILVEGLALGAFGMIRRLTSDPVLRDVLKNVITDEARHVHFGVAALRRHYKEGIEEPARREREDWAFEVALLLRNRFLARELHGEFFGHEVSRAEWDRTILASPMMGLFRETMFRRIVPNLKAIGLLSDRIRPRYEREGLLRFENEKAAPDLTAEDLLAEEPASDG